MSSRPSRRIGPADPTAPGGTCCFDGGLGRPLFKEIGDRRDTPRFSSPSWPGCKNGEHSAVPGFPSFYPRNQHPMEGVVPSVLHFMPDHLVIRVVGRVLLGATCLSLLPMISAENPADEHVKVELVAEKGAIVPNRQIWLGIRFDLQEGWHTYWVNPGDSGEAPRVAWELPAGFQAGPIQWPYPTRLSTPPFADYGYENRVLLPVVLRPAPGLKEGATENISVQVHYLVCRDVCIPGQKRLLLSLPVKRYAGTQSDPAFDSARRRLPRPVPESWKLTAVSVDDEFLLTLKAQKLGVAPQFFPLEPEQVENAAPQKISPVPGGLCLHLKKSNHLLKPIARLKGVVVVSGAAYLVDVPVSGSAAVHKGSS